MQKLWMAMTTGWMVVELNTRRGEGLHSRARSEHLMKKNLILQRYNFYCHNPCPHKQTDFISWKQCSCGQMRYCETRQANCNCDGTRSGVKDEGKILDKTLLPIQKVHFGLDSSSQLMDLEIGNVVCGPKPFGSYIDCGTKEHAYLLSSLLWHAYYNVWN